MSVATYYFDGSDSSASDPNNVWTNETNADDGSTSTSAYTTTAGSKTSNYIQIEGTNASGSGTISQVRARVYGNDQYETNTLNATIYTNGQGEDLGTCSYVFAVVAGAGWGDYTTLTPPSAGWSWETIQALETRIYVDSGISGAEYVYKIEIEVTIEPTPTVGVKYPLPAFKRS